jgi:hypothetical protein
VDGGHEDLDVFQWHPVGQVASRLLNSQSEAQLTDDDPQLRAQG